jgi:hypothetical protein
MKVVDVPHVKVYQAGTMTILPVTAFEPLTHALASGAEWWEGTTAYGSALFVRCATITDVHLVPQAAIDLCKAEDDEVQWTGA